MFSEKIITKLLNFLEKYIFNSMEIVAHFNMEIKKIY